MVKKPQSYYTTNNLSGFITKRQVQVSEENGWKKVTVKEIEEELAEYCQLSREGIRNIKKGSSQPSLPQAFKIAKYFGCDIEDIFIFIDETENKRGIKGE